MEKSLRTPEQEAFQRLLKSKRKAVGLTQAQLASRLGRPQSFVAKYETGERRLDVIEFCTIARTLSLDPTELLREFVETASV